MQFVPLENRHFNQTLSLLYEEWQDLFNESGFETLNAVKRYYKQNANSIRFFVLLIEDQVIACYSLTRRAGKLYLCDVVVAERYRGKGYSTILMKDALARATTESVSDLYLKATEPLVPFYKKYGFKVIAKNNKEFTMVLALKKSSQTSSTNMTINYFILCVFTGTIAALTWITMA